jgi:hypothetical protein
VPSWRSPGFRKFGRSIKCALYVHRSSGEITAELDFVIGAWPDLPEDFKEEIVEAIVRVLDKDK